MEAESFDKKIRDLLESAEFPYQEADWQKAQKLLQQERRRKAFGWFWLLPLVAVGSSWWMLLAGEPDRSNFKQLATLSPFENERLQAQGASVDYKEAASSSTDENAGHETQPRTNSEHTSNHYSSMNQKEMKWQHHMLPTHALEAKEEPLTAEMAMLQAKSAMIEPKLLSVSAPEKRDEEPIDFERPIAKAAPVFALGFWAATQPVWSNGAERSAGRLNWQAGLMASVQWQNGLYSQWLGGLQQQQLRNWTYTNTNTTFDFGFERSTQTLDLDNYWSLQNSLRLGYQLGNHRLFGSITHQHYLFSRYQLSTEKARQDVPPTVEKQRGHAAWQQAEIANWLPGLGYEYSLNQAFQLGVMYQFRPVSTSSTALPTAGAWQFNLQYVLFQRQKP